MSMTIAHEGWSTVGRTIDCGVPSEPAKTHTVAIDVHVVKHSNGKLASARVRIGASLIVLILFVLAGAKSVDWASIVKFAISWIAGR